MQAVAERDHGRGLVAVDHLGEALQRLARVVGRQQAGRARQRPSPFRGAGRRRSARPRSASRARPTCRRGTPCRRSRWSGPGSRRRRDAPASARAYEFPLVAPRDRARPPPRAAGPRVRSPHTASAPISSRTGTDSGETLIKRLMPDSSLDAAQKIAEPRDVEKPCGRIRPRRLEQDVVRVVAAQHVVDEVGRDGDLAAGLLAPADGGARPGRRSRATWRNVRFIRFDSASQASRSSPSMSSANSWPRSRRPSAMSADMSPSPHTASRSRWRRSPAGWRRRGRAGASAACRASGGRGGPRTDRRRDNGGLPRGKVSISTSSRAGMTERSLLQLQPLAQPASAAAPKRAGPPAWRARARRGASRAGTCRRRSSG